MAIIGGASAFAESTLAQIYKERDGAIFKGGPAYHIEKAMGMRWLGTVFAVLLIFTFAYGFNGLQAFNIVSAFEYYSNDWEHSSVPIYLGIILAVIAMVLFFSGVDKISKVSSILVPIMAALYILIGQWITRNRSIRQKTGKMLWRAPDVWLRRPGNTALT